MVVTIKDGNVIIEVEGAKGTRCLGLTQTIENLIGQVDDRFLKNDSYRGIKIEPFVKVNKIYVNKIY